MRKWFVAAFGLLLASCAGWSRSCTSCSAESFGSDWVVLQLSMTGKPFRCWELRNVSIANEPASDGIYWVDPTGNLVHLSGMYNRVQVVSGQWEAAFKELGLTQAVCKTIRDGMPLPITLNPDGA